MAESNNHKNAAHMFQLILWYNTSYYNILQFMHSWKEDPFIVYFYEISQFSVLNTIHNQFIIWVYGDDRDWQ
jgi:hypothetical protein